MIDKKHKASVSSDDSESSLSDFCISPENIDSKMSSVSHSTYRRMKRLRANDRERRRVHLINCAMESLRNVVPGLKEKRKLTKLDLLRAANQYIWLLDEALRTGRSIEELQREIQRAQESPKVYYLGHAMPVLKREQID